MARLRLLALALGALLPSLALARALPGPAPVPTPGPNLLAPGGWARRAQRSEADRFRAAEAKYAARAGAAAARRDNEPPWFPDYIPSCVACEPAWGTIESCAGAATVFENETDIMWNPTAFITEIECACTDTFQSAYPQCEDCFVQTNQCQTYLNAANTQAPTIVQNIRSVCSLSSALLGGVASSYSSAGESYPTTMLASQPYGGEGGSSSVSYGPGGTDLGAAQGGAGRSGQVAWGAVALALVAVAAAGG